mmetsp:Transcript_39409/g.37883  ORF Transcript_39409/g.37883 Transcript_39409/m.37883 type:complete len:93 (-) Transcript_39409:3368-3646(-)
MAKTLRVHAWAFQFLPSSLFNRLTKKIQSNLHQRQTGELEFGMWQNFYLSNRELSDENRYIYERQGQEKTIGNFLEKPTVLIKRNYIRDTNF